MRWGVTVLAIALLITLVWVSGCANLSLGSTQVADFGGNSADAQQAQFCFINKYGNPATYTGPARFLEPMVSDGISNNTPTNKVTKFSKDTPSVFAWAFYEGFKPGDQVIASWMFNGKQFAQLTKPVQGNYGLVYGQFDMPKLGWALGTHTITISGKGVQGSATFDIIDGPTQTTLIPCQIEGMPVTTTFLTTTPPVMMMPNGSTQRTTSQTVIPIDGVGQQSSPLAPAQQKHLDDMKGFSQKSCADFGGTVCNGICTDLTADLDNCGSCDKKCQGDGWTCLNGSCVSCRRNDYGYCRSDYWILPPRINNTDLNYGPW
jgi:hypothetical protein